MQYRKSFYTILLISLSVLVLATCIKPGEQYNDPRGAQFAGSAACVQCHQNIFDSYKQTAHHQTSHLVYDSILQQEYKISADTFSFPLETVVIEKKQHRFYQSLYANGDLMRTHSFDVVFGSGEKAETFAYWQENQLYQLPLSFFSEIPGWANSPGFPANRAHFDKTIVKRCFECHGSYIEKEAGQTGSLSIKENFNRSSIIYGIDCERCHGPSARHVDHHLNNPSEKSARYLIKWDVLSREQKLDACAVCHSGNDLTTQKSTFLFQPGDTLSNFYFPEFGSTLNAPDVHGKQMQLLEASACFQNSNTLDCTSCHNSHHNEKDDGAIFSQRCMNCHPPGGNHFCKMAKTVGSAIQQNCIDCHMPNQASKAISFQQTGQGHTTAYYLRTHKIGIYPTETINFINKLKTTGKNFPEPTKGPSTQ